VTRRTAPEARTVSPAVHVEQGLPDADNGPRHVLLASDIGGVLGVAMNAAEIKNAAELLALLYDAGTADDATQEGQAQLWQQVGYVGRMLWRTGGELYEAAGSAADAAMSEGGAQ
jgi:hypothetical protein